MAAKEKINPNDVEWISNGEKAKQEVLNRPVMELIDLINIELDKKVDEFNLASDSEARAGNNNTKWMSPLRVKNYVAQWWSNLGTAYGRGFVNLANASEAREKIGLNKVRNYEIASLSEARDPAIDNKYMTPKETHEAIKSAQVTVSGLGLTGEKWQIVNRSLNTNITNEYGKPIMVSVSQPTYRRSSGISVYVDDILISDQQYYGSKYHDAMTHTFIVPIGSTYKVKATGISQWAELR